jgi:hypothetical protein
MASARTVLFLIPVLFLLNVILALLLAEIIFLLMFCCLGLQLFGRILQRNVALRSEAFI